jgi:hypothetical protein
LAILFSAFALSFVKGIYALSTPYWFLFEAIEAIDAFDASVCAICLLQRGLGRDVCVLFFLLILKEFVCCPYCFLMGY